MGDANTSARQHHTVGWYFDGTNGIYLCTRWIRESGYDMRLVAARHSAAAVGQVSNVSERAIGRTFHQITRGEYSGVYRPHERSCNCFVCENREEGS